jgi:hypothetical protein
VLSQTPRRFTCMRLRSETPANCLTRRARFAGPFHSIPNMPHKLLAEILALEGKNVEAVAEQKRVEEIGVDAKAPPAAK